MERPLPPVEITVNRLKAKCTDTAGFLIDRPAGTDDYLLLHFRSPVKVRLYSSGQPAQDVIHLPEGSCLIYPPGFPQWYCSPDRPMLTHWIHFSGKHLDDYLQTLRLPVAQPFHISDEALVHTEIRQIQNAFLSRQHCHLASSLISLLVNQFLIRLSWHLNQEQDQPIPASVLQHRSALDQLRRSLSDACAEPWTLNQMARTVNLSVSRMMTVYQALYQTTPLQDLVRFRIGQACHDLITDGWTIDRVAEHCGYANPTHFYRQFRQQTGMTPGAYRAMHQHRR